MAKKIGEINLEEDAMQTLIQASEADNKLTMQDYKDAAKDFIEEEMEEELTKEQLDAEITAIQEVIAQKEAETNNEEEEPVTNEDDDMNMETEDETEPDVDDEEITNNKILVQTLRQQEEAEEEEEDDDILALRGKADISKRKQKKLFHSERIFTIGDSVRVQTQQTFMQQDYLELAASQQSQRILTGTIVDSSYVDENETIPCIHVAFQNNTFTITIPYKELYELTKDEIGERTGRELITYLKFHCDIRIGAEIDFIVLGVDANTQIAVASRIKAMKKKRREYFFARSRETGQYLLNEGDLCEARVIGRRKSGILVEIFGKEVYIPQKELSYTRIADVSEEFLVGDYILTRLTTVARQEKYKPGTNKIAKRMLRVQASVKEAMDDPRPRIFHEVKIGSKVTAVVTQITDFGIFARLGNMDGKIDILMRHPEQNFLRPRVGSVVNVQITHKVEATEEESVYRIYGTIRKILKR